MKRLLHILTRTAAILSLLIFLASAVFWVRGFFVSDRFFWQWYEDAGDRSYWTQDLIETGRGGIGMDRVVQSSDINGHYGPKARQDPQHRARYAYPLHFTKRPEYPYFNMGIGDEPVWGGFKRGSFSWPDPGHVRPKNYGWQIVMPYWAICLVAAPLPAISMWRWRKSRRRGTAGCCQVCGYDLRATPDRCPECGTVPRGTV